MFLKLFKPIIHQITGMLGIIIIRSTPREELVDLIRSLRPLQTDKELVRLGPSNDGGYLVPDDFKEIEACFSPGVDKVSEFEMECLRLGMKIFLADFSVDSPNLDLSPDKFDFEKLFISSSRYDNTITIDKWVNSKLEDSESDLLLQMDIEGAEMEVIINMSDELLNRFRIIVIEFHDLQDLWNVHYFKIASVVFKKLLKNHSCVHIHPNNVSSIDRRSGIEIPRLAEFTFYRNDRGIKDRLVQVLPHKNDKDNTDNPSIKMPQIWFK